MRVISRSRLKEFWTNNDFADSEGPLRAWYAHVSDHEPEWHSWGDLKRQFGTASSVDNCVVFNIVGNKYRMVTRVLYRSRKVFISKLMTHNEYDDDTWKAECGCFDPPPPKIVTTARKSPRTRNGRGS